MMMKNEKRKKVKKIKCAGWHKLNLIMVYFRAWHPGGSESWMYIFVFKMKSY